MIIIILWQMCSVTQSLHGLITAQKIKLSITDFFSKCDQIRSLLQIWSHLLKKSVMENFIFCAVNEQTEEELTKMAFNFSIKLITSENINGQLNPINLHCGQI